MQYFNEQRGLSQVVNKEHKTDLKWCDSNEKKVSEDKHFQVQTKKNSSTPPVPWACAAADSARRARPGHKQSHLIDWWLETCHQWSDDSNWWFVTGVMVTGDLPEDGQPRHGGRHQAWELRPSLWQRESVIDASRATSQCQKMFNRLSNNSNSKFQWIFCH